MPPAAALNTLTYADYARIPDDRLRHEIVAGDHVMSPAPGARHQIISARLTRFLDAFVDEHQLGRVMAAPFDVLLSEHDILQPDLIFLARAREALLSAGNLRGAPDLVIEILSPSNRTYDLETKYRRYEHLGVEEYWIVDPEVQTVAVYRRSQGKFASAESHALLTTPLLPGFVLDVAALFANLPAG